MTNRFLLILGDWLVLLLFVFIGQRDHQITGPGALPSLLLTTFAIALPWTLAAAVLGAYRFDDGLTIQRWLGRVLNAWLVAAPLGLVLRALLRGQNTIAVPFMLVMLGLGGLFMLAWRAAVFYFVQRRKRAMA
jgi:hypothetical protein